MDPSTVGTVLGQLHLVAARITLLTLSSLLGQGRDQNKESVEK